MPSHHRVRSSRFAKVAQLDPREIAPEHEDVVELDVAVHQFAAVNVMHRRGQLSGHPLCVKLAQTGLCYVGR